MTPVISSLKRAVSSYDTQQKYNERIKKIRTLNVQQRQVDIVTISTAARNLEADKKAKKETPSDAPTQRPDTLGKT